MKFRCANFRVPYPEIFFAHWCVEHFFSDSWRYNILHSKTVRMIIIVFVFLFRYTPVNYILLHLSLYLNIFDIVSDTPFRSSSSEEVFKKQKFKRRRNSTAPGLGSLFFCNFKHSYRYMGIEFSESYSRFGNQEPKCESPLQITTSWPSVSWSSGISIDALYYPTTWYMSLLKSIYFRCRH